MAHVAAVIFWGALGTIAYVVAGYPLLIRGLAALAPCRGRPESVIEAHELPSVSLIIAARNEAASIAEKLKNCDALDYPTARLEIIVVSDASDDGTDDIVSRYAAGPRPPGAAAIRLLRRPVWGGKTAAQNDAAVTARGEILAFSDATTQLDAAALGWLVIPFRDLRVAAATGRVAFAGPQGPRTYWSYESGIRRAQDRLGVLAVASGCFYSVRRSCYVPLSERLSSDIAEPLRLVANGHRVAYAPRAIARESTAASWGEEFRMRRRVVCGGLLALFATTELLRPWRHPWLAFHLFSHKVGRWSLGFLLLAASAGAAVLTAQPVFGWLLRLEAWTCLAALAGRAVPPRRLWPLLSWPAHFFVAQAAVTMAWFELLRGHDHAVWRPEREPTVPLAAGDGH